MGHDPAQVYRIIQQEASRILDKKGKKFSNYQLDKLLGLTNGKSRLWAKGQMPSVEDMGKIATALNINPAWLLTGEGSPHDYPAQISGTGSSQVDVPVFANTLDKGRIMPSNGTWSFPRSLAIRLAGGEDYLDTLGIVIPNESAMSPVIEAGDAVLIQLSQHDLDAGRIYAISIDDCLLLRRMMLSPDGIAFRAEHDNTAYPPLKAKRGDSRIQIVGAVIWSSRTY